ncbi:FAD/NAD(P)-binding protein [Streptomyces sp. NPDC055692]|uniref:FAD/NAD(P)-binding protein n=1 Tax=Streptomyces sp. NPDC055692 TaxID=3155683 RepID=UPI00343E3509
MSTTVVVIGAGPYGLSTAAHLKARGVHVRVFGSPMASWAESMPAGMLLKSPPNASVLSAPKPGYTLDAYCRQAGEPRLTGPDPVPVEMFVRYGRWFAEQLVTEVENVRVLGVDRQSDGLHLKLASGRSCGRVPWWWPAEWTASRTFPSRWRRSRRGTRFAQFAAHRPCDVHRSGRGRGRGRSVGAGERGAAARGRGEGPAPGAREAVGVRGGSDASAALAAGYPARPVVGAVRRRSPGGRLPLPARLDTVEVGEAGAGAVRLVVAQAPAGGRRPPTARSARHRSRAGR